MKAAALTAIYTLLISFPSMAATFFCSAAHAETQEKSFRTSKKHLEADTDRPSADTAPVYLTVDGVNYKIPRNYIVRMFDWNDRVQKDGSPTLKVTFPGFAPLDETTKTCLVLTQIPRSVACTPLEFRLGGSPSALRTEASRWSNIFHKPRDPSLLRPGPYGYTMIDMGIAAGRTMRFYLKDSGAHFVHVMCLPTGDGAVGSSGAVDAAHLCIRHLLTPNGGGLEYSFKPSKLKDVEEIDQRLSVIVDSFILTGAKQ
jgi:hypothetical protein